MGLSLLSLSHLSIWCREGTETDERGERRGEIEKQRERMARELRVVKCGCTQSSMHATAPGSPLSIWLACEDTETVNVTQRRPARVHASRGFEAWKAVKRLTLCNVGQRESTVAESSKPVKALKRQIRVHDVVSGLDR